MLLLSEVIDVSTSAAKSRVDISARSPFFDAHSGAVPATIGVEYMGQTAALIAGLRLQEGLHKPHLGILLGTRHYESEVESFAEGTQLIVSAQEDSIVGQELASFACQIHQVGESSDELIFCAQATLTVFRKPLDKVEDNG
jgi:predicted hotdog family 3-hydroxylacyl-ACP dehydratase